MTADFTIVEKWLNDLTKQKLEIIKKKTAFTLLEKVRLNFVDEQNPYAEPWQKLKYRQGSILRDKNNLFASQTYKIEGDVIYFGTALPYGAVHQYGYAPKNIPQRAFYPTKEKGLPKDWQDEILRVATIVINSK